MRILDLFCGEGGAGVGYHDATGAEVVGVDWARQPRYPFAFLRMNVLDLDERFLRLFDLVHASPPCQGLTVMRSAPNAKGEAGHPNLIPPVRRLLERAGVPWVIENVDSPAARASMPGAICLCGSMFGLGCTTLDGTRYQLQRHRLFIASFPIAPPCACRHRTPVVGVYGGHVRNRSAEHGGRATRDFVGEDKPGLARQAMQMPWATMNGMSEAIPPAFSAHVAAQFRASRFAEAA